MTSPMMTTPVMPIGLRSSARQAPCRTQEIPLGQAIDETELQRVEGVPDDSYQALAGRYGYGAHEVLALDLETNREAPSVARACTPVGSEPELRAPRRLPFAALPLNCEKLAGARAIRTEAKADRRLCVCPIRAATRYRESHPRGV